MFIVVFQLRARERERQVTEKKKGSENRLGLSGPFWAKAELELVEYVHFYRPKAFQR